MRISNNVEYGETLCLEFGCRYFTSLTMFGLEAKENLILCCHKFPAFVVAVIS